MATNYSANDKLRGKEAYGLPICLALAAGLLIGGIKYINSQKIYQPGQESNPEIRAVQSQNLNLNNLERLTIKETRRR